MTYPALRINIYCKNTKKNANRTYFAATVFNLKKIPLQMKNTLDIDTDHDRLDFKPVTKADIPLLMKYFTRFPSRSCDFSIGGTLMWSDFYGYRYAVCGDTLFIKGYDPIAGRNIYYQPSGCLPQEIWMRLIREDCRNSPDSCALIPLESETSIDEETTDSFDMSLREYLYPIERFLHFSGKKMEKKRNHLNYFINNYDNLSIESLSEANLREVSDFTKKFMSEHDDSELCLYENCQTLGVLEDFHSYPFEGIVLKIGGKIIGYTFGEKIGDMFFCHVEKGDITYRGVYQALASFMSREINKNHPDVIFLNREEDMGDESLRYSKESYHPALYINKRIENISVLNENSLLRIA